MQMAGSLLHCAWVCLWQGGARPASPLICKDSDSESEQAQCLRKIAELEASIQELQIQASEPGLSSATRFAREKKVKMEKAAKKAKELARKESSTPLLS